MKKTYQKPAIKAHRVSVTNIICASIGFGSGTTGEMHAKEGSFGLEGTITPTLEGTITPTLEGTITPTSDATVNFDE